MKILILLLFGLSLSSSALGLSHRHMLSFGRAGTGWNTSYEYIHTRESSPFTHLTSFIFDLGITYHYRLTNRIQAGFFYQHFASEYTVKSREGDLSYARMKNDEIGLEVIYNFHDDITNSSFLALAFSMIDSEEENSHAFNDAEGKAPFELDDTNVRTALHGGRRWTLGSLKFGEVTYAPRFGIFYQTHSKDFKDQRAPYGWGLNIEPVRIDVFF